LDKKTKSNTVDFVEDLLFDERELDEHEEERWLPER
jgi:hypothetical protein